MRRCHNATVSCIAYVVPLVGPQYLSLYLKEIETACHVTMEFLVAVVVNKEPYTTNTNTSTNTSTAIMKLFYCSTSYMLAHFMDTCASRTR